MSGWVKLHRKLLDWEWFDDHNTFRLFIFLLMKASHRPYRYKGNDFEAGTLITGRVKLSFETGLSERQTRTSLDKLALTGEVTIKSTNNYSVISITKWDDYQDSDQPKVQRMANERPATRPTDDHYTRKKELRREEDTNVSMGTEIESEFDEFWESFPKRIGSNPKKPAMEKFKRAVKKAGSSKPIIEAAKAYAKEEGIRNKGKRSEYTKQAVTWLNQECWNDFDSVQKQDNGIGKWVESYAKHGVWKDILGPKPDQQGCRAPQEILERYGYAS